MPLIKNKLKIFQEVCHEFHGHHNTANACLCKAVFVLCNYLNWLSKHTCLKTANVCRLMVNWFVLSGIIGLHLSGIFSVLI